MAREVTFIHAADLHLGAPFRGLRALSEIWAQRLFNAIPEAYERVIDAALERAVDFVVISGDIFDTSRASYGDYLAFYDGLNRLNAAGIPVYLCTGNHDPYTAWQKDFGKLPPNTTMFSAAEASFAVYERDGEPLVLIGGRSYYNQTWPIDQSIVEGISRADADAWYNAQAHAGSHARNAAADIPFAVGVVHSGLDLDRSKAPADPADLLARGMDYWALGHIHRRYAYPSENDPRIVFPGCVQGRDIKETGKRGCYLVTLTEGASNRIEFVPTASVVWQRMSVDVSECATLADVKSRVTRALFRANGQANCERMVTRITLTGQTDLHALLSRIDVLEDLRERINASYPEFFCDTLVCGTRAVRDEAALEEEGLFPSLLLNVARECGDRPEEEIAYLQTEFVARGFELPSNLSSRLSDYLEDAKNLSLDLLMGGDDQ